MSGRKNGFIQIEVLTSVAILLVVGTSMISMAIDLNRSAQATLIRSSLQALSESLISSISNQEGWDITRGKNPSMACIQDYPSTCPSNTQSIVSVYNSEGNILVDRGNPDQGFRADGSPCLGFMKAQSDCIFRAQVQWYVQCSSVESCKFPEELVSVTFQYKGKEAINLNNYNILKRSRLNLADNQSPMSSCVRSNKIFIGFNQKVRNGDNQETSADVNGCVSLSALQGSTGPQGVSGSPGVAGAQGKTFYATVDPGPGFIPPDPVAPPPTESPPWVTAPPSPPPPVAEPPVLCPPGSTCNGVPAPPTPSPPVVEPPWSCPPGSTCVKPFPGF